MLFTSYLSKHLSFLRIAQFTASHELTSVVPPVDLSKGNTSANNISYSLYFPQASGCRVWNGDVSSETTAKTQLIHENFNLSYSCALILCPVPSNSRPTHVALLEYPKTSVLVQDMTDREQEGRMSVCVKPMHSQYEHALWLVEFIEFYRLLGAERFIFYNHTMGSKTEAVVKHYMEKGIVSLLPWSLPVKTKKKVRTEGLFAALNDCNLRSVNRFTFSVMIDLDEFLIPRKHDSLLDLLDSYDEHSAYIFQVGTGQGMGKWEDK